MNKEFIVGDYALYGQEKHLSLVLDRVNIYEGNILYKIFNFKTQKERLCKKGNLKDLTIELKFALLRFQKNLLEIEKEKEKIYEK